MFTIHAFLIDRPSNRSNHILVDETYLPFSRSLNNLSWTMELSKWKIFSTKYSCHRVDLVVVFAVMIPFFHTSCIKFTISTDTMRTITFFHDRISQNLNWNRSKTKQPLWRIVMFLNRIFQQESIQPSYFFYFIFNFSQKIWLRSTNTFSNSKRTNFIQE